MPAKLSESQQALVDMMTAKRCTIRRYPGGFWAETHPTPRAFPHGHPEPWWGVATVRALAKRGVLVGVYEGDPEWKQHYRLAVWTAAES